MALTAEPAISAKIGDFLLRRDAADRDVWRADGSKRSQSCGRPLRAASIALLALLLALFGFVPTKGPVRASDCLHSRDVYKLTQRGR